MRIKTKILVFQLLFPSVFHYKERKIFKSHFNIKKINQLLVLPILEDSYKVQTAMQPAEGYKTLTSIIRMKHPLFTDKQY